MESIIKCVYHIIEFSPLKRFNFLKSTVDLLNLKVPLILIFFAQYQTYIAPYLTRLVKFIIPDERGKIPPVDNKILLLSANEIVEKIRAAELTCVDVISAYHARIKEVNPLINALIEFDARSYQIATELDRSIQIEREHGPQALNGESVLSKPMIGVPFTAKNCIGIAGLPFHVGIYKRKDLRSEITANCAQNMMNAGAIFIGTTNTPELSMDWDTVNKVFGRTCNPHDLNRSPGGSSGGEGALISAAGSLIGIGSDVGGSIRIPATLNGIYGLKPSQGVVTCSQTFPPSYKCYENMMTYGPLCRYSGDLKLALKAMSGENPLRFETKGTDFKKMKIYYVDEADLIPLMDKVDQDILKDIEKAARHFESHYNTKIEPLPKEYLEPFAQITPLWFHAMCDSEDFVPFSIEVELRRGFLNPYIEAIKTIFGTCVHTVQTIILCLLQNSLSYRNAELRKSHEDLKAKYAKLLGKNAIIFFPTLPVPARKRYETIFNSTDCQVCMATNLLALPSLARPTGLSQESKLPIGFQIVGGHLSDLKLIDVTCELDKVFKGWIPPFKL